MRKLLEKESEWLQTKKEEFNKNGHRTTKSKQEGIKPVADRNSRQDSVKIRFFTCYSLYLDC